MCGKLETDSRIVDMARRHPMHAIMPYSSSSFPSASCTTFQNAAARFCVMPKAKGAMSSPNFSVIVSSVYTTSSDSTSFMSLKNSSNNCGRMPFSALTSSVACTKAPSPTTASNLTGISGSFIAFTTLENSCIKLFWSRNVISEYFDTHDTALARI